jgi:uncharacterized protein YueI
MSEIKVADLSIMEGPKEPKEPKVESAGLTKAKTPAVLNGTTMFGFTVLNFNNLSEHTEFTSVSKEMKNNELSFNLMSNEACGRKSIILREAIKREKDHPEMKTRTVLERIQISNLSLLEFPNTDNKRKYIFPHALKTISDVLPQPIVGAWDNFAAAFVDEHFYNSKDRDELISIMKGMLRFNNVPGDYYIELSFVTGM